MDVYYFIITADRGAPGFKDFKSQKSVPYLLLPAKLTMATTINPASSSADPAHFPTGVPVALLDANEAELDCVDDDRTGSEPTPEKVCGNLTNRRPEPAKAINRLTSV
jgi:hypothetical protein